ncbi:LytTR family transcriptional regulator DNA-binding domain-containing protein [Bradyrhizobium sp. 141]|uniref:GAF domain-containing DNA-binding protein n=1 Tax=Bradyrhizobium sp. 141 TaxID=2782617 RepID=UPI001FF9C9D9|nr:LytTR family transcriptional regulator DNA-binding domain-containing protein [Bradyrhizobium sp. 141]MCK1716603.1 LytTR family transcriptional regulator DNA-binding domain-containing protein [Bradyrhizobium sp. 141]
MPPVKNHSPTSFSDPHPPSEVLTRATCEAAPTLDWAYHSALLLLEQPMEAAISAIMKLVGEAAAADRAWMFEYDEALLRFRNTHEWSRPEIPCFVEDLQDAPVAMIGWLQRFLVAGKAVMINCVEALPRTAQALRAEMLRQDDKSVLCVPVFHAGQLRACIGLDAVRTTHRWSKAEMKGLFHCADLIAAARYGQRADTRLDRQGRFAKLVYLRKQGGVLGTPIDQIIGLRSSGDYSEVWLADGSKVLDQRPLVQWTAMTPRALFLRIHRTAIINLKHVRDIDRRATGAWQLRLQHRPENWPVSRAGRAELRMRLGI